MVAGLVGGERRLVRLDADIHDSMSRWLYDIRCKCIVRIERVYRKDPNGTAKGDLPLSRPSFASVLSGPNGGFRLLPLNRGETPAARHSTKVHWPALAADTDRDRTLSVESLPVAPTLSTLAESFSSFPTDTRDTSAPTAAAHRFAPDKAERQTAPATGRQTPWRHESSSRRLTRSGCLECSM